VRHSGGDTGLTRLENTTRTRGESQEETWAEGQEKSGGHDEISLGEDEAHSTRDEAVHEEEHESVEENRHLVSLTVTESELLTVSGQENTWAESEKKGGWYGNLMRTYIGEHLIYIHIIFSIVNKVVKCGTSHHLFVKLTLIYNSSETPPNVPEIFVIFRGNTIMIRIMLHVTKFHKVTKLSCMFNMGIM
jgi:hypothetical protein